MTKRRSKAPQAPDEATALRTRLEETEETLRAIRQYMVDAFVVAREDGIEVMTLSDADFPYRLMVESMNEGAVTLIPDGTIFYCNQRFCEMMQVKSEQLIGKQFDDMLQPEQRAAFNKMLDATGQEGTRKEFCLEGPTGNCLPVQLSAYPLQTEGANGIAIIATDITERIQAEGKIRALVTELTNAEQVQQLRISQVLHDDLQQRLFAVRAQLSLVADAIEGNRISPKLISSIHQAQDWLSDAIKVTRDLSVDISPSILSSEGMAEAIRWLGSRMKTQHGLQVKVVTRVNFHNLPDHVRVAVFQAVRELLFNVVKHSGTLEATATLEELDGHARITIADQGNGFDSQAVLNDPQAVHGLTVIRDRLELMGGSMGVESTPGMGTSIRMEFPLEKTR
jgi:PAS domain S-box-containing protein